jgi:hypothetical protein
LFRMFRRASGTVNDQPFSERTSLALCLTLAGMS